MKPLNIFSLLKKTEELIEREDVREANQTGAPATGFGANVGYVFRTFPCRDARSREFARQAYEVRDFAKNLLLIAEKGTDVRTICEDLVAAGEHCPRVVFFEADQFDEETARAALQGPEAAAGVTLVFTHAEQLSPEQRGLVYELARRQGAFADLECARRFIFRLDRDLDDYYDEGIIEEEFYLFLGTTELRVPGLRQMPEDLPVMAETLLLRDSPGKELEGAARAFLQRHDWPGNLDEFREKIVLAARLCPGDVISVSELQHVIEGHSESAAAGEASDSADASPLENFLCQRRADYLDAFQLLLGRLPRVPAETALS